MNAAIGSRHSRRSALSSAAGGAAACLALACTPGAGAPPQRPARLTGTLVFWGQSGSFTFFTQGIGKEIMDRFRAQHPDLTLEVEDNLSASVVRHIEQVLQYAVGGTMPDVLLAHRLAVAQFGQQGLVIPLDDLLKQSKALPRDDLWPSHLQDGTWRGRLYGITHSTGVWVQFINSHVWRDSGLDPDKPARTWDDLQDVARKTMRLADGKLQRLGYHPTWNSGGALWFLAFLRQLGGDLLTADFRPNFNNELGTRALEFMKGFVDLQGGWSALSAFQQEISASITVSGAGAYFGSNRVATSLDSHTAIGTLDTHFKDLQYTTAVIPIPRAGKLSGLQGGTALTIPATTRQRDGAWLLIEHLMAPRNILDFSLGLARIPSRRSVAASQEYLQNDPRKKTFIEMVPHSFWTPSVPGGHEIADIVGPLVNDVLQTRRSIREALAEAESQTRLWRDKWQSFLV
jgi:multiple sugar transport system substrate-binding protein